MLLKIAVASFLFSSVAARSVEKAAYSPRATHPFKSLVAYGDELSDNGNGSFAHGITGDPANVYGFGTWTNGPVAVSYLADLLGIPLTDYAFGGCCGGGSFGATFDTAYTKSPAGATDMISQITNYTASGSKGVESSLQLLWFGQNDLSMHTDAFWLGDPNNAKFSNDAAAKITAQVKNLLDLGAPHVMVANIYPKHLAPVTSKYLCGTNTGCITTWGRVIMQANAAIKKSLEEFGNKVIYYDVFSFMMQILNDPAGYGFTRPLNQFCDGDETAQWDDCMIKGNANQYFWMNFIQPTTAVHQLIAKDMKKTTDSHFA
ncbi:GDSL-like Lipase/Acylhydrolase [Colletotrichum truncatum]|uniref:GDSL-like Lipase/Acylhydrolase n=1 Tax=Colletotrichum truncatum TaxID=5467 RepID=A0ACC3YWY3_COLTU|nr:GDSL-like Lipase/Acylhydrolase [Colletotrichum truncatum]KAF6787558.1 GDSL-like Lipase/Acylhydrolase [Colletotrichum truncatum]